MQLGRCVMTTTETERRIRQPRQHPRQQQLGGRLQQHQQQRLQRHQAAAGPPPLLTPSLAANARIQQSSSEYN